MCFLKGIAWFIITDKHHLLSCILPCFQAFSGKNDTKRKSCLCITQILICVTHKIIRHFHRSPRNSQCRKEGNISLIK